VIARSLCLLLLTLCCATPLEAAQPGKPATTDDTEKALAANRARAQELDAWMSKANDQLERWERDLKNKDAEVASIARQVEQAGKTLAQANQAIAEIEAQQKVLEEKRSRQAQLIGEHLAASYRMSGEDFVKLILNQQSPDQLNRLMRYHRYFTEARMDVVDDYQQTLDTMADNRFRLETQREDAAEKQQALTSKQQTLTGERKERQTLIARLSAEFEDKEVERKRLDADRQRLEELLAQLRRQSTELDGNAFAARRGSLPWPVNGKLSNAFGQPRADGRLTWTGVVITADEGTPVKAAFRGRVVFARWLRGFGLLTIIDHGGGYMTLYGHADILLKTEGEWVESGETISRAGRSGGQSTSGVYFEVRHKGAARDPIGWLAKR
jgi:septal ring factor EnvC (AmiA/AmiB activator)